MIHVGKMVKEEFDRHPKAHTVSWLAEQLFCRRNNIYDIFNRKSVDTDLLIRLSRILEHDFFKDISNELTAGRQTGQD